MKKYILAMVTIFILSSCSATTPIPVTTELLDAGGNVIEKTVVPIADANVAKWLAMYTMLVNTEVQFTAQNKDAGFSSEVTGVDVKEIGDKVYITALTRVTYKPPVARNTNIPTTIPDHWATKLGIKAFDASLWAFGIYQGAELFSSIFNGVRGISISGDGNVVQGAQNRAGGNQDIRSDYVTCPTGNCGEPDFDLGSCTANPPFGYTDNGTPLWSAGCSCGSYDLGECS